MMKSKESALEHQSRILQKSMAKLTAATNELTQTLAQHRELLRAEADAKPAPKKR